jgi:CspA family cold shock protein
VVVSLVERGCERDVRRFQREIGIDVAVEFPSVANVRPSPHRDPAEADRLIGTVAFFHDRRGYGFIDGGSGPDVFVHHSNLATKIATGQQVVFAVRDGRKGLEAYDVVAVSRSVGHGRKSDGATNVRVI